MKTRRLLVLLCLLPSFHLWGDGPVFSGVLDSSLAAAVPAGSGSFSSGIEEYANLRLQQRLGENAVFYAAFNCVAASGSLALPGTVPGDNYATALELERLFMRIRGETFDVEGGLLRLAFGYAQVWGPSDFLNPRNPLIPDARPRAVLGGDLAWYPGAMSKFLFFAAAPQDSGERSGAGTRFGLMAESHRERYSVQALYAYQIPAAQEFPGVQRFGLSFKLDLILGISADALYTFNSENGGGKEGLAAS
ncbi:MAG: hypothetical protein LBI85_06750, partial [Spirochaetaceae bacterium]|nr:hypothetical protein [Spirochaetaceae bacterium]